MSKFVDLQGKKYGKLTAVKRAENVKGRTRWVCRCDCGNETVVSAGNLTSGAVKSCGCLKKNPINAKHKQSKTPLYRQWVSMIYRCHNPKNNAYKYYGARGIKVCDEWHDFTIFKKWVDETKPRGDFSIDRIDNDGDYCPENCKWSSAKKQANNRRSNVIISYNNEYHTLMEWSEMLGFDYKNVHNRMYKLGWTFEKAINTPIDTSKRNKVERTENGRIHKQSSAKCGS